MTSLSSFPTNYQQWRHCIEVDCGIPLTPEFVDKRLAALQNSKDPKTQAFEKLYGVDHLQMTIAWFKQAEAELAKG